MKNCNQCGKCCIKYSHGGLSASSTEIELWDKFRPAIYRYVKEGQIWVNPDTGEELELCPWLRKEPDNNVYTCDIYHDRPEDCRFYPVTIEQMIVDECEMLSVHDLKNPSLAQRTLDKLMIDSRPAYSKD
ncbi:hypothetical protein MNBD_GAMMA12-10 [hydrothermal vent metagenome]|uniref:Fe-S-cluster oxidoreductase n=1 Tax=hydrothermal vent metagenome TaxID=652676 RepID=A0A3B0YT74_9ZZZZ